MAYAREVKHLYSRTAAIVAVLFLASAASCWAQGMGYSIWQKPTGETEPTMSWYGPTGLIAIPSALVGPPVSGQASIHWVNTNWTISGREEDLLVYGASVALTGNVELAVTRMENVPVAVAGSQQFKDATLIHAKYNVDLGRWARVAQAPEVAFGVWDIGDEVNRAYYVAVTKPLHLREPEGPVDLTLTIGYGNNEADAGALDGLFAGVELAPAPMVKIQAEYDAEDFNACIRFFPTRNLSIDVATIDSDLGVGATYRLGF